METFGDYAGDRVIGEHGSGGGFGPALELLLRHPRPVGNHAGQVHGIVIARLVQRAGQFLVALDLLGDRLQVANADSVHVACHAVTRIRVACLPAAFAFER